MVDCTYEPDLSALPACKYFDNELNVWATDGCVTAGYTNTSVSERAFPVETPSRLSVWRGVTVAIQG
jgi:hypothetical protein